jgi:hypothetical protein
MGNDASISPESSAASVARSLTRSALFPSNTHLATLLYSEKVKCEFPQCVGTSSAPRWTKQQQGPTTALHRAVQSELSPITRCVSDGNRAVIRIVASTDDASKLCVVAITTVAPTHFSSSFSARPQIKLASFSNFKDSS